jgi:hypothetical protein
VKNFYNRFLGCAAPAVVILALSSALKAADLSIAKAQPIEYVRVCSAYGVGYFYVPGTDTCIRVGGRARFEYGYISSKNRSGINGDASEYRGLARFNIDARTQTAYGTLRAFVRLEVAGRTGSAPEASAVLQRYGLAFPALGPDAFNRAQTYVQAEKAFIQFAGLTAGRASSFFDFYARDFEISRGSIGSDVASTNLLAYTATLGAGFSTTLSLEDPMLRRQPIFASGTATANAPTALGGFSPFGAAIAVSPVIVATNAAGVPTVIGLEDVTQKSRMPDFVGALRYDAAWGSAQLSAAVHEVNGGNISFLGGVNGGVAPAVANAPRASNAYGWAVQGGIKVNLPMIAAGDSLYLQGAYGFGAMAYTGYNQFRGAELQSSLISNGSPIQRYIVDAVLNPFTGRYEASNSFSVVAAYLHYWTPEIRSAVFGSYGEAYYRKATRSALGAIGFGFAPIYNPNGSSNTANLAAYAYSDILRNNSQTIAGANLIWSPIRDLDIGIEAQYIGGAILDGVTNDLNKNPRGTTVNGVPIRTSNSSDAVQVRMRIQRDF